MKIKNAIEAFLRGMTYSEHSPHTLKAYRQDLLQWQETVVCEDFNALTFDAFQTYFETLHLEGLKASTLRRKRVVIHRFLKYCYDKHFCQERLYEWIDPIKLKKQKKPKEVLTTHEIQEIFTYIRDEKAFYSEKKGKSNHYDYLYYCWVRNHLLTSILLYTGCRANEAVSIMKKHIDFENHTLTILAKGNKYNSIPIHEQLEKAFKYYEEGVERLDNELLTQALVSSPFLFPARMNAQEHLATRTLHDLMIKYSEVLGRHIHAHIFRHTFASYCIAANMDISTISSLISHSNPSITLSIYTHEIESNQKHREMKKLTFQSF